MIKKFILLVWLAGVPAAVAIGPISGGSSGISASSTDTLTNKTIDATSNTLLNLSVTSIKDGTDLTKILNFDVSAIPTATTRTLTFTSAGAVNGAAASGANGDITSLSGLTGAITSAQGTITANSPALSITQTWNNGAVSFVPLTMAITDTASTGVGSAFLNFTKGGTSEFSVNKSGIVVAADSFRIGTIVGTGSGYIILNADRLYSGSGSPVNIGSPGLTNTVTLDGSINKVNTPFILKGYTINTLPAGTVGMMAYVTDALAPTYNAALVGGGGVTVPVFYNGSAWVSH